MTTHYIAAYDTELPGCLQACRRITEVHREFQMPATFFVVGATLRETPQEYRELLDDPLFEIASHTDTHALFFDHPICGKAMPFDRLTDDLRRGKETIEDVFGRPCRGVRAACCFVDGLRNHPEHARMIRGLGFDYVSTIGWGPDFSLPAPLTQSFTYEAEGCAELREFPGHGFHENLLKANNPGMSGYRALHFPLLYPEAIPPDFVKTPAEEFKYNNKVFIDHAIEDGCAYVNLIWHPWSLGLFDPDMAMLEMTFKYVGDRGLPSCTFVEMNDRLSGAPA